MSLKFRAFSFYYQDAMIILVNNSNMPFTAALDSIGLQDLFIEKKLRSIA